jgi:hypothetical protein
MIARKKILVARSDIHIQPQGKVDLELFNSVEYATKNELFVLPQQDIIKLCHASYGKLAMSRKPTTDDKDRAVGIAITDEDIWQLFPDMLGKTKGGTCSELDAPASSICQRFHLLHGKFVDTEVVVTLPEQWEDLETACKIDEILGQECLRNTHSLILTMIVELNWHGKLKKCRVFSGRLLKNTKQ